jgi:hypothetical protein
VPSRRTGPLIRCGWHTKILVPRAALGLRDGDGHLSAIPSPSPEKLKVPERRESLYSRLSAQAVIAPSNCAATEQPLGSPFNSPLNIFLFSYVRHLIEFTTILNYRYPRYFDPARSAACLHDPKAGQIDSEFPPTAVSNIEFVAALHGNQQC